MLKDSRIYKNNNNQEIYLAKSREDLLKFITDIYGRSSDTAPQLDKVYNDTYFLKHYVIVLTCVAGGSNTTQSIDKVELKGQQLLINRTVSYPSLPSPDINCRFVMIEVDNTNLKNVTSLTLQSKELYM